MDTKTFNQQIKTLSCTLTLLNQDRPNKHYWQQLSCRQVDTIPFCYLKSLKYLINTMFLAKVCAASKPEAMLTGSWLLTSKSRAHFALFMVERHQSEQPLQNVVRRQKGFKKFKVFQWCFITWKPVIPACYVDHSVTREPSLDWINNNKQFFLFVRSCV